jgi:protein required for attachment to host cells
MVQHRIPCFLIADGGHARFVWPAEDNALHTREALDSVSAHKQDSDLVSDRPGRSFESASATRHAYTPRTDPHDQEKLKFADAVGEKLCALSAEGAFNELILVAPAEILAEVREKLDTLTEAKVTGTLAKDLAGVPDHELYPHLKQWIRPVHRQ